MCELEAQLSLSGYQWQLKSAPQNYGSRAHLRLISGAFLCQYLEEMIFQTTVWQSLVSSSLMVTHSTLILQEHFAGQIQGGICLSDLLQLCVEEFFPLQHSRTLQLHARYRCYCFSVAAGPSMQIFRPFLCQNTMRFVLKLDACFVHVPNLTWLVEKSHLLQ